MMLLLTPIQQRNSTIIQHAKTKLKSQQDIINDTENEIDEKTIPCLLAGWFSLLVKIRSILIFFFFVFVTCLFSITRLTITCILIRITHKFFFLFCCCCCCCCSNFFYNHLLYTLVSTRTTNALRNLKIQSAFNL